MYLHQSYLTINTANALIKLTRKKLSMISLLLVRKVNNEMNRNNNKKDGSIDLKSKNKIKQISEQSKDNSKDLSRYQRWRLWSKSVIDERLKVESKREIILKFFAAPIICVFASLFLYISLDFDTFTKVGGLMLAYFFPPAGKETVIPTGVLGLGIHPIIMAFSIAFVDIVTAIFLLWNYDFAKLIPYLGPWMEKVEKKGGKKFQENSWLEGLAFLGLILFVMFPFQGSGGVGTSIVGRVIGMDKYKVVYAITIGAITGSLLIAYISEAFKEFFRRNILLGIIIFIIIIVAIAIYLYYKNKKDKENI